MTRCAWFPRLILALLVACAAGGCATSGTPGDPFEGFNRAMFGFNESVDRAVLQPVAQGYKAVVPEPARDCVGNVFSNINDIFVGFNSLLQGKVGDAVSDVCRVVVNTTVGLLGCFDVASKIGLEKHDRDFGQTFGKWGFGSGPYLVLPFLGPSTVREGIGTLIYTNLDPVWADHVRTRNVLYSLRAVNRRAELLTVSDLVGEAALDKYSFVRDAYLQRRQGMIDNDNRSSALPAPAAVALNAAESLPRRLPASVWVDEANQRAAARTEPLALPAPRAAAPRQAVAGLVVREF
jgi:phospholipid-binding lipoprotein MlaA